MKFWIKFADDIELALSAVPAVVGLKLLLISILFPMLVKWFVSSDVNKFAGDINLALSASPAVVGLKLLLISILFSVSVK